jgi:hypothetical protein
MLSRHGLAPGRPGVVATPDVVVAADIVEGVLDGVLQQFGQHHGQRGGHVGRHLPQFAGDLEGEGAPLHHRVLGHPDERGDDLVEGHLVARLA